jgi:acyl-CoA reductase-like NAD-dependent aldehyde dehydrogenase
MTEHVTSRSPVTGEELRTFTVPSGDAVSDTMEKARSAADQWREASLNTRTRYLRRVERLIANRTDELVDCVVQETGKPRLEALTGDVMMSAEFVSYYASNAREVLETESRSTPLMAPGNRSLVEHRPYGVVAIISPWNYPIQLTLIPAITALVAGNAVVIKPSEYTPITGERIGQLLNEAGGPEHLVSVVQGAATAGQHLVDAGPDKIFFTGSVSTGQSIRQNAAEQRIPVELEMGGNDPMIVCDDANVLRAARAAAWGGFSNAGQMCISIERAYVHEDIADTFLDHLLDKTSEIDVGGHPDADVGPMIHPDQTETIRSHVRDAVDAGATLHTPLEVNGRFVQPVVLSGVRQDMDIMQEETFGPVIAIRCVSNDREAIELANDSRYGLNASVFSGDEDRARSITTQLDVGACYINNVVTNVGNPDLPFGGNKSSGLGRYHGPEGLHAFTKTTSIMIDRWYGSDEPNWFPYAPELYDQLRSLLLLRFGDESFPEKLRRTILLIKKLVAGG